MSLRRWAVVERLVKSEGWKRGAEVGVHKGKTFKHLLTTCPDLELYGIDLWDTAFFQSTREGRPPKEINLELDLAELSVWLRAHAPDRGVLIRQDTRKAAEEFEDGFFDFAFIDADHRYEGVKADIEAWLPKAKCIIGHDYNEAEFPGVVQAVHECFSRHETFTDHVWRGYN